MNPPVEAAGDEVRLPWSGKIPRAEAQLSPRAATRAAPSLTLEPRLRNQRSLRRSPSTTKTRHSQNDLNKQCFSPTLSNTLPKMSPIKLMFQNCNLVSITTALRAEHSHAPWLYHTTHSLKATLGYPAPHLQMHPSTLQGAAPRQTEAQTASSFSQVI